MFFFLRKLSPSGLVRFNMFSNVLTLDGAATWSLGTLYNKETHRPCAHVVSRYILGIKMIIQFFIRKTVYIRILCHSQKYFLFSFFLHFSLSALSSPTIFFLFSWFTSFSFRFFFLPTPNSWKSASLCDVFRRFPTITDRVHSESTWLLARFSRFISLKWNFHWVSDGSVINVIQQFFETSTANTPFDLTFTLRVKRERKTLRLTFIRSAA